MKDGELRDAIREHALLHGDFVLRSGRRSSWYLDKYRFETQPKLLRELGTRLFDLATSVEPELVRLAGPELGAVPLAAAASLAGEVPYLIVRREAKGYGTDNRIEGAYEEGELVCLVEDVVTSGGAALDAIKALRAEGLRVSSAVCVLDREDGGVDELARHAVRLHPLFRGGELLGS
jgi:orotate phosphoribosyltransferase